MERRAHPSVTAALLVGDDDDAPPRRARPRSTPHRLLGVLVGASLCLLLHQSFPSTTAATTTLRRQAEPPPTLDVVALGRSHLLSRFAADVNAPEHAAAFADTCSTYTPIRMDASARPQCGGNHHR